MPEFAKDMRVTTGYRSHVINSGLIAWTFYEKRRQHRRIDEPTVNIRRKRGRKKRTRTIDISRCESRYHRSDARAGWAGSVYGSLFLWLLAGLSRLAHIGCSADIRGLSIRLSRAQSHCQNRFQ